MKVTWLPESSKSKLPDMNKKIRHHKAIHLHITANESYWLVFSHGTVYF